MASASVKLKVKKVLSNSSVSSSRDQQSLLIASLHQLNNVIDAADYDKDRLNSVVAERQVRITEQVVEASEDLIDDLAELEGQVNELKVICERIESSVQVARSSALPMLAERDRLLVEGKKTKSQVEVLEAFNALFNVKEEEVAALESSVSPAFFLALGRVQSVHANCRLLLRSNHRRAGLELMDRMSTLQEKAYENLCRWVQSECSSTSGAASDTGSQGGGGGINPLDSPSSTASAATQIGGKLLKQAIEALKSRPVLLKYCAEEVASARHNVFFRKFLDALTKGAGPSSPSIEQHMNTNPVKYVRKIFEWLSQNIEREKEVFSSLFSEARGESSIEFLLDRVFEGVCRPLRVRLEQVLLSTSVRRSDTYQICRILEHYSDHVVGLVGEQCTLAVTVRESCEKAVQKFGGELKQAYSKLLGSTAKPLSSSSGNSGKSGGKEGGVQLDPPAAFLGELEALSSIISMPTGGVGGADNVEKVEKAKETASRVDEALGENVKILCEFCEASASQVLKVESEGFFLSDQQQNALPRGAHQMYLANCYQLLLATLAKKYERKGKSSIELEIETIVDKNLGDLVAIIVEGLMAERSLAEKLERIRLYQESDSASTRAMARDPALGLDDLKLVLSDIHTYMLQWISGDQELPSLKCLKDAETQKDVQNKVLTSLSQAYDEIYTVLADPANRYPKSAVASIQHSPQYIQDLLKACM